MADNIVDKLHFKDKKEIQNIVLNGRFAKNTKSFINQTYKFAKPKDTRQERLKRTLIVARGIETYDNIYGFRKEQSEAKGQDFLKNDWFLGPFYSYNHNSKNLRKQQL